MSLDTSPTALRINRKNMVAFINADPIDIQLTRGSQIRTAAGGVVRGEKEPLTSQRFRLTPFKRRLYDITHQSTAGNPQVEDYVLVGRHDADILPGDQFDYRGNLYTVDSIEPKMDDRPRSDRVVAKLTIQVDDPAPPVPE